MALLNPFGAIFTKPLLSASTIRADSYPPNDAARWKQFRGYFVDVALGRTGESGATLLGGVSTSAAPMNGYPKVFNIEADPREEHNIGEMYEWVLGPLLKATGRASRNIQTRRPRI
jgi:hypothetical protein